jgi:hypothetical protein
MESNEISLSWFGDLVRRLSLLNFISLILLVLIYNNVKNYEKWVMIYLFALRWIFS